MSGNFEKLRKILRELESINKEMNSKALRKAIDYIKIALKEEKDLKGSEGFAHYLAKKRLAELFGGCCYYESEGTGLSKEGYRPDAILIKDDEAIILEVETDKRRILKKFEKIRRNYDKILSNPIFTNRRVRIVFGVFDFDDRIARRAKNLGIELYKINEEKIERITF